MMSGSVAVTSGTGEAGEATGWLRDVFVGSSSLSLDELVGISSIVPSIVSDCEWRYETKSSLRPAVNVMDMSRHVSFANNAV